MKKLAAAVVGLTAMLTSAYCSPDNVGAIRDAGAQLLSRAEVVALLKDTSWEASGNAVHIEYRADGSFTEFIRVDSGVHEGQGKGHFGTWSVDPSGKECESRQDRSRGVRCQYWFRLNGAFFIATDADDRGARVGTRHLKN
jgi:hypothetical protein